MNLNELTLDNMGSWPTAARITVIGFTCAVIFALFFVFDVKPMRVKIAQAIVSEDDLRSSFQVKYSQVVNRDAYLYQVNTLLQSIKLILAELPAQLDVPELIGDIAKIGSQAGLNFNYIKPQAEINHTYYTALPIEISVNGNYQQLTNFITELARIPRIVTIDDFSINRPDTSNATNNPQGAPSTDTLNPQDALLVMNMTAVTYKQNKKKK